MNTDTQKTVVGLFDNLSEARNAVQELAEAGFQKDDLNLIAHASTEEYHRYFDNEGNYLTEAPPEAAHGEATGMTTGAGIGAVLGGVGGLLIGMALVPIPGIGPIVAAGPITAALMGAVGGGIVGGLLGALVHVGVPEDHANYYTEGVRRGGTLVIVKTGPAEITRVTDILNRHDPVNIEERVSGWKQGGWNGYDSTAQPYSAEQIASERQSYRTADLTSVNAGMHPVGTGVGAAGGAVVGAAAGSVVPVVGTAAGAVIGGVAGAVGGHEVAKHERPYTGPV